MCSRFRWTSSVIRCTRFPLSRQASATCSRRAAALAAEVRRSGGEADDPAQLSFDDEDRRVAADSLRVARKIVAQPAIAPYKPEEYLPGGCRGNDDAALIKAAGDIGTTIFHPVGTAKMGRDNDPFAVVRRTSARDGHRGSARDRRFGDARHHLGKHQSPTMMIAEKGAAMIAKTDNGRQMSSLLPSSATAAP